jgi:hypothetical protein
MDVISRNCGVVSAAILVEILCIPADNSRSNSAALTQPMHVEDLIYVLVVDATTRIRTTANHFPRRAPPIFSTPFKVGCQSIPCSRCPFPVFRFEYRGDLRKSCNRDAALMPAAQCWQMMVGG